MNDADADLSELQHWMTDLLRSRRALGKNAEAAERARAAFTGNPWLSPVEQADVYRQQFWLRHTSSLVEDFPGLGGILGQEDWERLVEEYLVAFAPEGWTLRDLGRNMPVHVERSTWLPQHGVCLDMARLEWLYTEVFDAADAPTLDYSKLAAVPEDAWPEARIVLHPALRLLRTEYPVAELRRRIKTNETSARIPGADRQCLVLYRGPTRSLHYDVVGEAAFELLTALAEGVPLGAAGERAALRVPHEAKALEVSVGQWFREWGRRSWITDVVATEAG